MCARQESNPHPRFRRPVLYPLSYGRIYYYYTLLIFYKKVNKNLLHLIKKNIIIIISYKCGVGLVVEHVLAKDETGVRFSYAAHF